MTYKLTEIVRKNKTIDWDKMRSVRSDMKMWLRDY